MAADKHLSNEDFFVHLKELFDARRTRDHGAVYLTQKRLTFDLASASPSTPSAGAMVTKDTNDPLWDTRLREPLPVIVRATNGKSKPKRDAKVKLSTVVQPGQLSAFYARYADVCRAGMSALKPRDRSKRKKDRRRKRGVAGVESEKKA